MQKEILRKYFKKHLSFYLHITAQEVSNPTLKKKGGGRESYTTDKLNILT